MSEQQADPAQADDDVDASTDQPDEDAEVSTEHLDDMEDGCGCAEVWEHLSERRDGDAADG
jgi:hypothetical protein